MKVQTHNIFKANEVKTGAKGWIVDLSPGNVVNPDFYWRFETRKDAEIFANLVNNGEPADYAMLTLDRQKRGGG